MNELKTTSELVKEILEGNKKARNSDSYLYYVVCQTIAAKKGIDLEQVSMPNFLLKMNELGMPGFETVRRSRQKAQHDNPQLSADENVEAARMLKEKEYRDYAKDI